MTIANIKYYNNLSNNFNLYHNNNINIKYYISFIIIVKYAPFKAEYNITGPTLFYDLGLPCVMSLVYPLL